MLHRTLATAAAASATARRPMFDKILIANRGEIACRVMRTCKELGVKTVAVYSDIDANSLHVSQADEAYRVGTNVSSESYLKMQTVISIAQKTGAKAIHPGYGFLSENPDFADLIEKSNLVFIGPPGSAIRAMGSKSASKEIMQKANVPVVPGYHGENQNPQFLKQQAALIGYPVLIKAVKGGGGKGMRIVEKPEDFDQMLESSKREAQKSFGDTRVLVEKYLSTPRHVEVQVFCDKLGNAVYLFERDCSVQRRHQKIIEEAPAPDLDPAIRKQLGEKAVAAAKAVNYVGAGTVEFIMDSETKQFYFMEMNTRLQVEHPVTEMITQTDLVRWQLEVAAGNRLPLLQNDLKIHGHSFETRIYAENPRNNFLPDTGKLLHLKTPLPSEFIRVETGVRPGDEVSVFYDPMIAKLVVWGEDRNRALQRLRKALGEYEVVGPSTNIEFLQTLAAHPNFIAAEVETGFIKKHEATLLPSRPIPSAELIAHAVTAVLLDEQQNTAILPDDPYSPWSALSNIRINSLPQREITLKVDDNEDEATVQVKCTLKPGNLMDIEIRSGDDNLQILQDIQYHRSVENDRVAVRLRFAENQSTANVVFDGDQIHVFSNSGRTVFSRPTPGYLVKSPHHSADVQSSNNVKSPMPSKLAQLNVKVGDSVKKGTPLLILEAMKMEHVIRAPFDGVIERISFGVGDMVGEGQTLVKFKEKE